MIITELNGGLGNQLFQYAAGRAAALRLGVELGLDLRIYDGPAQFGIGLDHFNITASANPVLPPKRREARLKYLAWRALRLKPRLFREDGLSYNEAFGKLRDGSYLKGYWQSERYFREYAAQIRTDLQIKTAPSPANARLLDEFAKLPAVSLHIRRGDYVSNPKTQATHGSCSPAYYDKAIHTVAGKMKDEPVVFAFSDDPAWVRENLRLPFEIRVMDHNDSSHNYEDMRLMAACRHNIIANSSFSWWGAWLNANVEKIVIGPATWYLDPNLSNEHIVPMEWIKIDNMAGTK